MRMQQLCVKGSRSVVNWLYLGMAMVFAMVLIGGITRLTGSGLSITEWEVIRGSLPPLSDAAWDIAFNKYKAIPQYVHVNNGMTLSEFKFIYFWEWFHRLWGRLIGLVFLFPFVFFWIKGFLTVSLIRRLFVLLFLGALQGFAGWYMVKSGVGETELTSVSHFRLALHLSLAFLTISFIYWIVLGIRYGYKKRIAEWKIPGLSTVVVLMAMLGIQIVFGAFTAGLHAGHASHFWPRWSAESWMPEGPYGVLSFWLSDPSGVQFFHRTFAWLVVLLLFFLTWQLRKSGISVVRKGLFWVWLFVGIQVLLGIITVWTGVGLWPALMHQFGALLLLLSLLNFSHRLRYL
jgi:cytochrome c oxidase assembly protein subunit 15